MKLFHSLISLTFALQLVAQEMPRATAEHHRLAESVGVWDAALVYTNDDGTAAKSSGISVRRQPLGEFWVVDNFTAQLMGQAFKGQGTTGYDPAKKKYVGTWVDSLSPSIMVVEGNYDATGKILTMQGMGPSADGKPVMHKLVTTTKDQNTQVFEMFVPDADGKDQLLMTITYSRRVRIHDEVPQPKAPTGGIKKAPAKKEGAK
jgi:hypothetical protein